MAGKFELVFYQMSGEKNGDSLEMSYIKDFQKSKKCQSSNVFLSMSKCFLLAVGPKEVLLQ